MATGNMALGFEPGSGIYTAFRKWGGVRNVRGGVRKKKMREARIFFYTPRRGGVNLVLHPPSGEV